MLSLSFVDVPLIFSCPADNVLLPDWQPRTILLGLVEARSVSNVKTTTQHNNRQFAVDPSPYVCMVRWHYYSYVVLCLVALHSD